MTIEAFCYCIENMIFYKLIEGFPYAMDNRPDYQNIQYILSILEYILLPNEFQTLLIYLD